MKIIISNKIRVIGAPESLKNILIDLLKVENSKYNDALRQGYSTYKIDPYIYNFSILPDDSMLLPRGIRKFLLAAASKANIPVEVQDESTLLPPNFEIDSSRIVYRGYQARGIKKLVQNREGVLVSAPGSGKTIMGLSLLPLFGQPMLWLTHNDRLFKQTKERLDEFFPSLTKHDIGLIGRGKWSVGKLITIAMVPTLSSNKNIEKIQKIQNSFGILVLDEAHHCPATTFTKVVSQFNPFYIFGLTATPYRRDKLEKLMFQILGQDSVKIPLQEVVDERGIILPTVKYVPIKSDSYDNYDFNNIITKHIIPNYKRNALITGDVLKEAREGNACIVISGRRAHCTILYEMIKKHWDKTAITTGEYDKKHIDEQIDKFYKRENTVLVATGDLLGEGFDVDFLNRGFLAMPFRTEGKTEQIIGRLLRVTEDKKDAVLYDYVDVDIGMLNSQFRTRSNRECRYNAYMRLGVPIVDTS